MCERPKGCSHLHYKPLHAGIAWVHAELHVKVRRIHGTNCMEPPSSPSGTERKHSLHSQGQDITCASPSMRTPMLISYISAAPPRLVFVAVQMMSYVDPSPLLFANMVAFHGSCSRSSGKTGLISVMKGMLPPWKGAPRMSMAVTEMTLSRVAAPCRQLIPLAGSQWLDVGLLIETIGLSG